MNEFQGKTAVITGAAGGIGLALARRAAREGMRLVLADVDEPKLAAAAAGLDLPAERFHVCPADVSREDDVARLAEEAFGRFGAVHLLCNNAGVALARPAWEYTTSDWEWILGVNVWSVIFAVRHFVPRMLEQRDASHIVNTASVAGLLSPAGMAAYNASKHAVVALSETLLEDLVSRDARVGVSALCPAWVPTDIHRADRVRPERFGPTRAASAGAAELEARMAHAIESGRLGADDIADAAFAAVAENRFYVIPHIRIKGEVQRRMENILQARNPAPRA